jgi:hypothetical protein
MTALIPKGTSQEKYADAIGKVITERTPVASFQDVFTHHDVNEIKAVIEWEKP